MQIGTLASCGWLGGFLDSVPSTTHQRHAAPNDMTELQALGELLWMLLADPGTGVLIGLLVAAAVIDWRTHRIPNWLTVSGTVYGLLFHATHSTSVAAGLLHCSAGLLLGLALLLPLWLVRILGAGDVKLMAMAGAFLGPWSVLHGLLYVLIAGGALALAFAAAQGALRDLLGNLRFILLCFVSPAAAGHRLARVASAPSVGRMPYGLAISSGLAAYLVVRQFA